MIPCLTKPFKTCDCFVFLLNNIYNIYYQCLIHGSYAQGSLIMLFRLLKNQNFASMTRVSCGATSTDDESY